ncbi:hypothetical protein BAE44_0003969 [Dichanthelium oligosanthes]|uniref:MADS-box domain-containing protein n=1 Tax=Dichanthelium oligosanthes TaxID=888268 RepID=A0A1E5WCB6_9POAL|nr:hypothetical protein BAE44_0003969 [Dichanthelium oligosanthes]
MPRRARSSGMRRIENERDRSLTFFKLQNELFQLEKDMAMEDKRKKENMTRAKEIQETSRMAKYIYGKIEDLDATELHEMDHELSRIKQVVDDCLPGWRSMPSHVAMLPKYSP